MRAIELMKYGRWLMLGITVVVVYLTIWDAEQKRQPEEPVKALIASCTSRGGVFILSLDDYVCVKLERL